MRKSTASTAKPRPKTPAVPVLEYSTPPNNGARKLPTEMKLKIYSFKVSCEKKVVKHKNGLRIVCLYVPNR